MALALIPVVPVLHFAARRPATDQPLRPDRPWRRADQTPDPRIIFLAARAPRKHRDDAEPDQEAAQDLSPSDLLSEDEGREEQRD